MARRLAAVNSLIVDEQRHNNAGAADHPHSKSGMRHVPAPNARVSFGVIPPLGVSTASSGGINSSAPCHQSADFFSRHFITSAASDGVIDARCVPALLAYSRA